MPRLSTVFDTIQERALHLQSFLEGYATLSKIPAPQPVSVPWGPFLDGLRGFWPGMEIEETPIRPGFFDRAQIQQVLINRVKNAHEAGGPKAEVNVTIETGTEGGCRISVLDRGPGISDEVMQNVFLRFFTTKPTGDGLGLALSREIVELHQGRLGLARREGVGMSVSVWLPDREGAAARRAGRESSAAHTDAVVRGTTLTMNPSPRRVTLRWPRASIGIGEERLPWTGGIESPAFDVGIGRDASAS